MLLPKMALNRLRRRESSTPAHPVFVTFNRRRQRLTNPSIMHARTDEPGADRSLK